MKHGQKGRRDAGPSQRQLRAGELVRHALAEILREEEINDGALEGVSVTVTEVRMSPDLRHAHVFVEPLGGVHPRAVVEGLNRAAKFLRGKLGRHVELKFTPDLRFVHDESFEEADRMERLIAEARRSDVMRQDEADEDEDAPVGSVRVFSPSPSTGEGRGVGEQPPQPAGNLAPGSSDRSGGGSPPPRPSPVKGEGEEGRPSPVKGEGGDVSASPVKGEGE